MSSRLHAAGELANQIAPLLEGRDLDIAATALAMNLAGVLVGYPPSGRAQAQQQIVSMIDGHVRQLDAAGAVVTAAKH